MTKQVNPEVAYKKGLYYLKGEGEGKSLGKARECFDFASLQRQLRILGTLSRLHLRDKKSFRLPDLIKTLEFFIETTSKYKRFQAISSHLGNKILPILKLKIKEIL